MGLDVSQTLFIIYSPYHGIRLTYQIPRIKLGLTFQDIYHFSSESVQNIYADVIRDYPQHCDMTIQSLVDECRDIPFINGDKCDNFELEYAMAIFLEYLVCYQDSDANLLGLVRMDSLPIETTAQIYSWVIDLV